MFFIGLRQRLSLPHYRSRREPHLVNLWETTQEWSFIFLADPDLVSHAITLRVAEGALCGKIGNCGSQTADPNHGTPYTDGARASGPATGHVKVTGAIKAGDTYLPGFPYLETPIPGSPNGVNGVAKN